MSYIVSKKTTKYEYRIYTNEYYKGEIVYSGHKLGVPDKLLLEILLYKIDRTNKIYFLDYLKWITKYNQAEPTSLIDIWDESDISDTKNISLRSWSSLLNGLKHIINENFKNVYITICY